MDEKIYARGLYHQTKDEIELLQEKIKDIKNSMIKNINSDDIKISELKEFIYVYEENSKSISSKWMEVHELKKIWNFK